VAFGRRCSSETSTRRRRRASTPIAPNTIDISGHGLRALRHIDACPYFDDKLIRFKGLKLPGGATEERTLPGWTGSRGDILRALTAIVTERHRELVRFEFETRVNALDVHAGALNYEPGSGAATTKQFDFVVGADGAGSVVRNAMLEQVPGFTVERKSLPNYCTMVELDLVGDQLDENYLHGLSTRPFCAAGAIKGEHGPGTARWFCAVGTKSKMEFSSTEDARRFFRDRVPRILELASEEAIAAFARRTCYHIGQKLTCSQLVGGMAVLIGDAAAPFPPIGQGVNAAMESAMVLDLCIDQVGLSPNGLLGAAELYNVRWKPEVDAVSWISEKSLFENRYHFLRSTATAMLGLSIFDQAKSAEVPYSKVKRKADRLWPLWA
jgi:kynurenine 3-monooxygenase